MTVEQAIELLNAHDTLILQGKNEIYRTLSEKQAKAIAVLFGKYERALKIGARKFNKASETIMEMKMPDPEAANERTANYWITLAAEQAENVAEVADNG